MNQLKTNSIIAGIDYSMSNPCVCLHTGNEWSYENCKFYYYTQKKKFEIKLPNIIGSLQEDWNSNEERFEKLTYWARSKFYSSKDLSEENKIVEHIFIEGYSMGSKGQVFNIGENTGLLKHYLWFNNFKYEILSPSTIKKFATGKGNADKFKMHDAFVEDTKQDLEKILQGKRGQSPLADIIDAYFITKLGFNLLIDKNK